MKKINKFNCQFKLIAFVLFFCSIFMPFEALAQQFSGGSGTSLSPYLINTSADLTSLKTYVDAGNTNYNDKYYKVTNNITWSNPDRIGGDGKPFMGNFDGGGYTISFDSIGKKNTNYVGFFGQMGGTASMPVTVKNLTLSVSSVNGTHFVGILAGDAFGTIRIENVHVRMSSYSKTDGAYFGGLIGRAWDYENWYALDLSITASSAHVSMKANGLANENIAIGGLIGAITSVTSEAKTNITDCFASLELKNPSTNHQLVGALIGSLTQKTVTLTRVATVGNIDNLSAINRRGALVGFLTYGSTLTFNTVYISQSGLSIGENHGTCYNNSLSKQETWTGNSVVYDYLERRTSSNGTIASTTRGNECWAYDNSTRPQVSNNGIYAVKVTRGSNVNISGANYSSGTSNYVNSNVQLTCSPSTTLSATQRIAYTFTADYDHSSGSAKNYTASVSGNNWLLTARVTGTVNGTITNIPYPTSPSASFDQWNNRVTITWNYNNPNSVTGRFHVYRRETAPSTSSWTLVTAPTGLSAANGSNLSLSATNDIVAGDLNKTFEYCIGFTEDTGNAPASPNDIGASFKTT
ncbi:MAG: hypothetical protein FWC10_09605, partial [Lentimicrobiaceae bacterium]|nr:hypothetical protein [Lentimicrobiaceae bacterium]